MDLNHQPRAYEAYGCLSPPSIPKTMLIAFSFGRAGLNPLDFSEGACQRLCPPLNSVLYCKQITQFGKRLSSEVSWSGLRIQSTPSTSEAAPPDAEVESHPVTDSRLYRLWWCGSLKRIVVPPTLYAAINHLWKQVKAWRDPHCTIVPWSGQKMGSPRRPLAAPARPCHQIRRSHSSINCG